MTKREREREYRDALRAATVAALPRRTAHALHALLEVEGVVSRPTHASELVLFDTEAPNARSTGAALAHAQRDGWAVRVGSEWCALPLALEHKHQLADRFLDDTKEDNDG